ncbi:polysaccharide deacetylase family protein [Gorillibacterium timonense]|uniref:polysaccharide deacetylase family protein n=1 Tax=Gorillibacterium timonense TaxID=1689269 RepID=UPI00071D7745|nr:polysaccharide deacetylase family protein [Gorillibacterium timonense]
MKRATGGILAVLLILSFLLSHPDLIRAKSTYSGQVAVLMYHHIADDNTSSSTITTRLFREQIAYLKKQGYRFISIEEFKAFLGGASVPDKAVLVTFDDGYESYYRLGLPIMKEYEVPSINFIITSHLRQKRTTGIPALSAETIRTMLAETLLAKVGSHSDDLHRQADNGTGKPLLVARLTVDGHTETDSEYEARIRNDLTTSRDTLKELSPETSDVMAYPYGVYDKKSLKLIKESGIRYGFTIAPGMVTASSNPLTLPRINAGSPDISPDKLDKLIRNRVVFTAVP